MNNVLITGVSGGIGKGTAEKLLAGNSSVIGIDLHISDGAKQLAARFPGKLSLIEYDLTDVEHLSELVKKTVEEYGKIEGFVHCAGFDKMSPLHMAKITDIENLWRIHALVPMVMISAISKKQNHGEDTSIVLISSQSAHEGAMGHSAYASAKGRLKVIWRPPPRS